MTKTIAPTPLSDAEYVRLTTLKAELMARSWKDLLLKCADIYDQRKQKAPNP